MKKRFIEFKVRMPVIPGVAPGIMQGYIEQAVNDYCGQAMPPQNGEEPDEWWLISEAREEGKFKVTRILRTVGKFVKVT